MKTKFCLLLILFSFFLELNAQTPITLIESTIKIPGLMEDLEYFGFQKGDKIILNFEESKGKSLKEIEISHWPNRVKFADFKSSKIENKIIEITETGVYKFRFTNSAALGRICKIKIQRLPKNDTLPKFNSTVFWRSEYDTTYIDKLDYQLISTDTVVHNLTDQIAKVHSQGNLNGATNTLNFTLPENTVGWSYYIGVDQGGQQAYQDATKKLAEVAGPIIRRLPGYGPMAELALNGVSYIAQLQSGEDVNYYIVAGNNVNNFLSGQEFYYIKKGLIINTYSQMQPTDFRGPYHVCLSNDNAITGIQVTVKVTAVTITENWDFVTVKKMVIDERKIPYLEDI